MGRETRRPGSGDEPSFRTRHSSLHVAHVVIDCRIDEPGARDHFSDRDQDTFLLPDRMAETYWHLVEHDDVSTQPFEVHVTNGPQSSEFR